MQDYVFYCVPNETDGIKFFPFGIKRGTSSSHEDYFKRLLDLDTTIFSDTDTSGDWPDVMQNLAINGYMMVVNSACEIERLEDRMYLFYLPGRPSYEQLNELSHILEEIKDVDKVVKVYGDNDTFSFYDKAGIGGNDLIKIYLAYHNFEKKSNREKVMKS